MKLSIFTFALCCLVACGINEIRTPAQRFITDHLPEGVLVYGFHENYDGYNGQYELRFFMKNETGQQIKYPGIEGDFFVDGKLEGPITGGPGKHLENLDSGVVSLSWILPTKVPDSVVFKFIQ